MTRPHRTHRAESPMLLLRVPRRGRERRAGVVVLSGSELLLELIEVPAVLASDGPTGRLDVAGGDPASERAAVDADVACGLTCRHRPSLLGHQPMFAARLT